MSHAQPSQTPSSPASSPETATRPLGGFDFVLVDGLVSSTNDPPDTVADTPREALSPDEPLLEDVDSPREITSAELASLHGDAGKAAAGADLPGTEGPTPTALLPAAATVHSDASTGAADKSVACAGRRGGHGSGGATAAESVPTKTQAIPSPAATTPVPSPSRTPVAPKAADNSTTPAKASVGTSPVGHAVAARRTPDRTTVLTLKRSSIPTATSPMTRPPSTGVSSDHEPASRRARVVRGVARLQAAARAGIRSDAHKATLEALKVKRRLQQAGDTDAQQALQEAETAQRMSAFTLLAERQQDVPASTPVAGDTVLLSF